MLDLNASAFLHAATMLARVHQVFSDVNLSPDEILIPGSIEAILLNAGRFRDEADKLGARLSVMAADRLILSLSEQPISCTVRQARDRLYDIESRFADYLSEIKMFVMYSEETNFLKSADILIGEDGFSSRFPSASFEIEESAKCLALGRHTASVFHAMRMLEVGIRALAKRLAIPDPTKAAEKNWAVILKTIKEKIDLLWPSSKRISGSEGSVFDELYANLEAVRNPWRNATMHVETIYAPHEALHIIRCSSFFLRRLSALCDEAGNSAPEPMLQPMLGE